MSTPEGQTVYRVRRLYRKGTRPKKYRGTFELADERTRHVEASCDLIGRATFATLEIRDGAGQTWVMKPNRRVAPSRWIVTDPEQRIAAQFTQKALAKLTNPLYRVALAMLDGDGRETYRLVDARTNLADRIMVAPGEWAIVQDDKPVAKLVSLPRHDDQPRKGLLRVLRKVFAASDDGIVSAGAEHVLEPPVALGTYLLHRELTDSSIA